MVSASTHSIIRVALRLPSLKTLSPSRSRAIAVGIQSGQQLAQKQFISAFHPEEIMEKWAIQA